MAEMYLMCGNISVGKSHYAKQIAEIAGFRYLNIDDCYGIINGDERIHENKFEVWHLFFKLIHMCVKLDQDVVIDTNAPYVSDRVEFLNWFPEFEKHTLVWVDAPIELAIRKNAERKRVVPVETMIRLASEFEIPTEHEPSGRSSWDNIIKIEHRFGDEVTVSTIRGNCNGIFEKI